MAQKAGHRGWQVKCVLCGRALFSAALSVPTRNGPLAYGPKCARKAGLVQKAGHRTSHVQKKAPRPRKAPANTIDVYVDTHTMSLFEETAC